MRSASGCWPGESQSLLLSAALDDRDAAAASWATWRDAGGIEDVDHASFRLFPLLYANLANHPVLGADEARLRGVHRQTWARNQRRLHGAAGAITALANAGIETLGLKGLVLAPRYYRNVGARSMADVDLVTRDTDVGRAVDVLQGHGWRLRHAPFARERRRGASTALVNVEGEELDLHWHVLHLQPFTTVDDEFWSGSERIDIGVAVRALQPADELLHTIVHGLHWNPVNSLRWIADAVVLLRGAPAIDWDRFVAAAERYALARPVELALDYLEGRFGVSVPERALSRVRGLRVPMEDRIEWWARMRGPGVPMGPFAYAVRYWRQYRRLRRSGSPAVACGFGRYLADSLRVNGLAQVAQAIVKHTSQRRT